MMNVAQQGRPASETINDLASKLKFTKTSRQATIEKSWNLKPEDKPKVEEMQKRQRWYVPKPVVDAIFAAGRGSTTTQFKKQHYCKDHKLMVDSKHIRQCTHLADFKDFQKPLKKLKTTNLRDWNKLEIILTILRFSDFRLRITSLEQSGTYELKDRLFILSKSSKPARQDVLRQSNSMEIYM